MKYISTRGGVAPMRFSDAVMAGLAADGGLFIPDEIPVVSTAQLTAWRELPYHQLATEIMSLFIDDIPKADVARLGAAAYATFDCPEVAPVVKVGDKHILELFHGPTLAFKDIALQFLGNLFEYILKRDGGKLNIIGATSGDTGSAAIYGVRGRDNIEIFIMHPHRRVSPIQERQMTTVLDANVHNIAIRGSFDDGQRILKEILGDAEFKLSHSLGAVNSVNWARVLAQTVYYFSAALKVTGGSGDDKAAFVVPTGNFGDIFAGFVAWRMGAPIEKLVVATNENDIIHRAFSTGEYSIGQVAQTLSPAMDIQIASNFERWLYYHLNGDSARLAAMMGKFKADGAMKIADGRIDSVISSGRGGSESTLATIDKYWRHENYLLDPHTAVGVHVADELLADANCPVICLGTAHPAKFKEAIVRATGKDLAHHRKIDGLETLPTRCATLDADTEAIKNFMLGTIG